MNKFKKYCPNVFVAECDSKYQKGDIIEIETKYGKKVECQCFNYLGSENDLHYYSVIRLDGFNSQTFAQNKIDRLEKKVLSIESQAEKYYEASKEGKDFLALGEPIKIGHHSERRHRALIERNHKRFEMYIAEINKIQDVNQKMSYWEEKASEIKLDTPESLEFFTTQLQFAKDYHQGLKNGIFEREHSYSLAYANKAVKELEKKVNLAQKLWGE